MRHEWLRRASRIRRQVVEVKGGVPSGWFWRADCYHKILELSRRSISSLLVKPSQWARIVRAFFIYQSRDCKGAPTPVSKARQRQRESDSVAGTPPQRSDSLASEML